MLYDESQRAQAPLAHNERVAYRPLEAARMLGIGKTTIYRLLEAGVIRSIRVGRCRLIPVEAIEEFLAGGRHHG